jgi:hypothetical protein
VTGWIAGVSLQQQRGKSMASYSTDGCSPTHPDQNTTEILLNHVSGPGLTAITVFRRNVDIQGQVSNGRASIYLNPNAFSGFRSHITNHPHTTVRFTPEAVVPPPFEWG